MKYVLLFVGTMEDQERFDAMPSEEMAAGMKAAERWFEEYSQAGKIVGGEQLKGPQTVTTVRSSDGKRIVTDGPFIESKEVIGGFAVVQVKDLDEALEMAKSWPAGPVEVWPAVER
ncbi:MAG: hypothetical protein E6I72_03565 [Chloroflexi bacterium]|nr:MAG: hypothetical protein E6I72_03565 [Chloroflexota bacterium]